MSVTYHGRAARTHAGPEHLRIMLALEPSGGGVGRHVLDLADGLLRRNHTVCLVYSPVRADEGFRRGLARLSGADVHAVPMRRAPGLHDLRDVKTFRTLIRDLGPFDALHAHSSKAGGLLRLALVGDPSPCVYTPHAFVTLDPDLPYLSRLLYGTTERLLARLCHRIICVSEHELEHARALGIPSGRLAMIPNGIGRMVSADRASVRGQLGLAPETVCIGTVGRLSHQKTVDRLVRAYSLSEAKQFDTRLVIVGEGAELPTLHALVRSLGLGEKIILTGQADGTTVMAAFDVFALSSRYEAFPYVLLEAAALALPIVMSETGGASSIVQHMHNGFVVPQDDTQAFAERLDCLVRQPSLRRRMGECSRSLAAAYSIDRMVELTIQLYRQVIREAAGSEPQ